MWMNYIFLGGVQEAHMFADCTGKKILVPSGKELGARGVVILTGIACGIYQDLFDAMKSVVHIERTYMPDKKNSEKYQRIYELYRRIYMHVAEDWWERHHLFQNI
jgi:sugar (pentulose or hexulose) kinase